MKEDGIKDKILNTDLNKINKRNEELETIQNIQKENLQVQREEIESQKKENRINLECFRFFSGWLYKS